MVSQGSGGKQPRPASASKASSSSSSSSKASKSAGRSSRRDSIGFPGLLEPPPSKQRRGSLQLPFREHFFASQNKAAELRALDDPFGSLRSRRGPNLSIDETYSVPSTSPQGTLTFSEGKKIKSQKLSVVSLFANNTPSSKDREKHEQLHEILGSYSHDGLPRLPELLSFGRPAYDDSVFRLEAHWSILVDNASALTKRQHDQQEAVWELLNTELNFISQVRVIIDVFKSCLLNVQQDGLLNDIDIGRLFGKIDSILDSNCRLWQDSLTKVLEDARVNRHPLNPSLMKTAFTKEFQNLIQPYTRYCMEQKQCVEYMKKCYNEDDLFKIFVTWAEAQKQCNRLKLTDLLVKPMQRLTKYSLLLQAILRKSEDDRQRRDLLEMIASVDKYVSSINSQMQQQHELERLEAIMTKIEPYDAVEAPNDECVKIIAEYNCNFNLMAPMSGFHALHTRTLLMHSSLRMKESQSRTDVDCFLFTDLMLVCKASKRMDKFKIIRSPMRLDQLVVSELKDKGSFLLIYLNEYHIPMSAYTFHGDQAGVKVWLEKIREAQADYGRQKSEDHTQYMAASTVAVTEEVEYSPLPGAGPLTMHRAPPAGFPRSASMESTEGHYLPNLAPAHNPRKSPAQPRAMGGGGGGGGGGALPLERTSSGTELPHHHHQHPPSSMGVSRVMSAGGGDGGSSSSPHHSPLTIHDPRHLQQQQQQQQQQHQHQQHQQHPQHQQHLPVKASHSVPNMRGGQLRIVDDNDDDDDDDDNDDPGLGGGGGGRGGGGGGRGNVLSVTDAVRSPSSSTYFNLAEPGPVYGEIEDGRGGGGGGEGDLNGRLRERSRGEGGGSHQQQRRVSRSEKRYFTADSIQELRHGGKDRDSSIHKRLSWQNENHLQEKVLRTKVLSSDSITSVPSSSGVSSTGSLHLNPESDISEEAETMTRTGSSRTLQGEGASTSSSSSSSSAPNKGDGIDGGGGGCGGGAGDLTAKAKSTPDIVMLFNSLRTGDPEGGISSVEIPGDGKGKLSHAQILKMKKQLLLNTDVEASEV